MAKNTDKYDSSWDFDASEKNYDDDAFDAKCDEWDKRDWASWLKSNLSFPFQATREENMDDNLFTDVEEDEPFQVGSTMDVVGLGDEDEDERYGILVEVKEGKSKGTVPLADLEVTPKTDKNFWPVREYVVWMANH